MILAVQRNTHYRMLPVIGDLYSAMTHLNVRTQMLQDSHDYMTVSETNPPTPIVYNGLIKKLCFSDVQHKIIWIDTYQYAGKLEQEIVDQLRQALYGICE